MFAGGLKIVPVEYFPNILFHSEALHAQCPNQSIVVLERALQKWNFHCISQFDMILLVGIFCNCISVPCEIWNETELYVIPKLLMSCGEFPLCNYVARGRVCKMLSFIQQIQRVYYFQ